MKRRLLIAGLAAVALLLVIVAGGYGYHPLKGAARPASGPTGEVARLQKSLDGRVPARVHVVIDQTHNRLEVRRGREVLISAICSAGSGMVLKETGGQERQWIFDTPRGIYQVRSKMEDPVWKKPDWAFIEAGEPVPTNPGKRIEYGALGEYALYFGNGFMIHGTLYERMLGRSVTHGCIRLGRDDLAKVFKACPVGTPIYIF